MSGWRESVLSFSALPEVGPLLLASAPAWIWSREGSRILWANPAGGARLGAANLWTALRRRWPESHPLRRQVEGLFRAAPEKGTLARLRILDDSRSVPVAARVRRIRAGDERGLLIVAIDGAGGRSSPPALASFLSGDDVSAVILGEAGEVLAEGAPELAGLVAPNHLHAEISYEGRKLRLFLLERRVAAAEAREDTPNEQPAPPLDNAGLSMAEAEVAAPAELTEADEAQAPAAGHVAAPEPAQIDDEPAVQAEAEASEPARGDLAVQRPPPERTRLLSEIESRAAELAWISPMSTGLAAEQAAPHPTAAPARSGASARIGRQDPPPATPPIEAPAPPVAEAPGRSITAGRVPRELSRKPVRFLWQTDAGDRFLFVSPGLAQVVGRNAEIVGERWQDAAARLRLDPTLRIARSLAQRDTWSGQTAWWPIEGSNVRVPAELTALPVFGGDQSFQGYRGFGVLRPAEALMPAAFEARFGSAEQPVPRPAEQLPPYEEAMATTAANVVPIRADLERMADHARLTPQERSAFEEIAAALRQRVVEAPAEEPLTSPPPLPAAEQPAAMEDIPAAEEPIGGPAAAAESITLASPAEDVENSGAAAAMPAAEPVETPPVLPAEAPLAPRAGEAESASPPPGASAPPEEPAEPAPSSTAEAAQRARAHQKFREGEAERRLREMNAALDTATDGVLILDADGVIESANASAEALFGLDWHEMQNMEFAELLTPESRQSAQDYLSGLKESGVASLLNEGREVAARAGTGSIPLFMTMGRISGEEGGRFCVVLRDITHWKRTEAELIAARRAAEVASSQKSEFLARVSHEIRTPLNAIIGFAEVMIEERFGPVENERYREYLRDIRTSGEHVVSLVNDLLDISKIEAGKLDLNFVAVPLNDLVRESIALMQPQANRAHVVLRSSLSRDVPAIVADQRTLRQIVLNLLSNSVKFTGPGGQVIASTSLAESGEALLRIRDTGEGMSEDELARALEPFRQIATATLSDRTGTGLGLPLTKALVEANRASLTIRSARGEGTVVTVTFPPTRVLSE